MTTRLRRTAVTLTVAGLVAAVAAGCSEEPAGTPGVAAPTSGPPPTAGPPSEAELAPGWEELPDGEPPVPDEQLSEVDLRALLRTGAQVQVGPATCPPDAIEARLVGFDAALGHRFTSLRVRNVSKQRLDGDPDDADPLDIGMLTTLRVSPFIPWSE